MPAGCWCVGFALHSYGCYGSVTVIARLSVLLEPLLNMIVMVTVQVPAPIAVILRLPEALFEVEEATVATEGSLLLMDNDIYEALLGNIL